MELASPITIYWDLPAGQKDTGFNRRICSEILLCRPLMLQLSFPDIRANDGHEELPALLHGSQIAVTATVPAAFTGNSFADTELKELLALVVSLDELSCMSKPHSLSGISFSVNRDNWRDIPELVSYCVKSGLKRVVLPMQRLTGGEAPFYITRQEQRELASLLESVGGAKELNLTIHDPFLWRAFNPDLPFPQAGCQAANTMVFIDQAGDVYPCPTLPVCLGRVDGLTLKEVIASSAKKEFRRKLLEVPENCQGCGEVAVCRGGCRGRGLVLHESLDGIDSACL